MTKHPLGVEDLLLVIGVILAFFGHFYLALGILAVWGLISRRVETRYFRDRGGYPAPTVALDDLPKVPSGPGPGQ